MSKKPEKLYFPQYPCRVANVVEDVVDFLDSNLVASLSVHRGTDDAIASFSNHLLLEREGLRSASWKGGCAESRSYR